MKNQLCAALSVLVVLAGAGCSSKPPTGSLTSRVVKKTSVDTVRAATLKVFQEEFYTAVQSEPNAIVFERPASGADKARWARYGEQGMGIRVITHFDPMPPDSVILRADAYILRAGDRLAPEEKITLAGRRPYRKLLSKVEKEAKKMSK